MTDDDDDDETEDDDTPSTDEALTLFLRRPPSAADHVLVTAFTNTGDQVIQDRIATEARKAPAELANMVMDQCERFARAEGREIRFRATWQQSDRVLASHQWRCGEGDPTTRLDGTVESFLSQQQRHDETNQRLHHEGFAMLQEGWRGLLSVANKRIEALERDNEALRERLRKVGDVDAEIAVQQVAADLEARSRTADILEHKLLPVVTAMVLKAADGPNGLASLLIKASRDAAAAPGSGEKPQHDSSDNNASSNPV